MSELSMAERGIGIDGAPSRATATRLAFFAAMAAVLLAATLPAAAQTPTPTPAPTPTPSPTPACDGPMTFTAWTSKLGEQFGGGSREYIFADGAFCPDTDKVFQDFLNKNPPKAPNTIVVLNSPGGIVELALAMGRIIRAQKMWTQVGSQFPLMIGGNENIPIPAVPYISRPSAPPFPGYCYSACTETFLGGIYRTIDYGSNYGVHRFYYETAVPNPADTAQEDAAVIVAYLAEMGISPDWMNYMVKQGRTNVTNLSMKVLQQLNVVTPHWHTKWQITPLSDNSGFYLDGTTTDPWGTHDIAITCGKPSAAQPTQPTKTPPATLTVKFSLDPGTRAKAQDLVGAVQQYVIEEGDELLPVVFLKAQTRPTVDALNRLTATVNLSPDGIQEVEGLPYIGFAFMFDPNAKPPLRLLQFVSDVDSTLLKQFVGTCH